MRASQPKVIGLLVIVLLVPLVWWAWQASAAWQSGEPQRLSQVDSSPTPSPTATAAPTRTTATPKPRATSAPPATATAVATVTPTPTITLTPSVTPSVTPTLQPTVTIPPDPIDRTCPPEAPLKPVYNRFFLAGEPWPTPAPDAAPHFWLAKPLPGGGRLLINQGFPYGYDGGNRYLLHNGVDSAEDLGTPVLAVADGTVIVAGSDAQALYGWRCDWYGNLVVIQLDQTWRDQPIYALYGHVLNLQVEPGQRVARGQPVAEVGFGGAAVAPHLHFEVRVGENDFGATRNPMLWIEPGETRGVVVGRLVDPQGRPWQGVALRLLPQDDQGVEAATWSYLGDPQDIANPDEGWAENFVFADVRPGTYDVYTLLQDVEYRQRIMVRAGQITTVELVTEPFKTPTPSPESSPPSAATPEAVATAEGG